MIASGNHGDNGRIVPFPTNLSRKYCEGTMKFTSQVRISDVDISGRLRYEHTIWALHVYPCRVTSTERSDLHISYINDERKASERRCGIWSERLKRKLGMIGEVSSDQDQEEDSGNDDGPRLA